MSLDDQEQVEPSTPAPPRRQQGGLMAVLGLLVPVVMGGVTVFGVYFLFLEDWLKPPKQAAAEPEPEPAKSNSPKNEKPPVRRQSTFAAQPRTLPDQVKVQPASQPMKTGSQASRTRDDEVAAENALGLAQKMLGTKPSAAPDWFQKVVDRYPGTKAAEKAQAWLKQHSVEL